MILIPLPIEKCIFACWFGATSVPSDLLYSTKSNLHSDISSLTILREPVLYSFLTHHVTNFMSIFFSFGLLSRESVQVRGPLWHFVTSLFLCWGAVSPTPKPKLEDQSLSAVRYCLFNISAAGGSLLRTLRAVVTRDPPNKGMIILKN
jgi:hypothetical protein